MAELRVGSLFLMAWRGERGGQGECKACTERTEYGWQSTPGTAGRASRGRQAGPRHANLGGRRLSHEEVPGRTGEGVEVRVRDGWGVPGGGVPGGGVPAVGHGVVHHLHARGRDDATGGRRRRRRGRGRGAQPRTPVERRARPSAAAVKLRDTKHWGCECALMWR